MEGVINMTEEVKETEVTEENTEVEANNEEGTEHTEPEKKYSDEDVNNIIDKKFAKWQKEKDEALKAKEDAIEEAKKLEKMNAEEKQEHERQKLEKELEEYKRKDQFYQLSKEASKMLSEHNIHADDELLEVLVKDDAEGTSKAVNGFVDLLNAKVEEGVKKALSGKSPKVHARTEKVISSEEFKNMTYPEKVKLKTDNPEMYNKIIKE